MSTVQWWGGGTRGMGYGGTCGPWYRPVVRVRVLRCTGFTTVSSTVPGLPLFPPLYRHCTATGPGTHHCTATGPGTHHCTAPCTTTVLHRVPPLYGTVYHHCTAPWSPWRYPESPWRYPESPWRSREALEGPLLGLVLGGLRGQWICAHSVPH